MRNGLIPGIPNRTKQDQTFLSNDLIIGGKNHNILSLAAGMGNVYSAAIFRTL
jgi:hypothetical protein